MTTATNHRDVALAARCHVTWMKCIASAGSNPTVDYPGMTAVLTDTPIRETVLALHSDEATVGGVEDFLAWSDGIEPERTVAWAAQLDPRTAATLSAHGFLWLGKPTWMVRRLADDPQNHGEAVTLASPIDLDRHQDDLLVCLNPDTAQLRREMARRWPDSIRHYISWSAGQPVGQASACIDREVGAASVHDAYLHREARPSGVGYDRLLAPLQHLRQEGIERIFVAAEEEGQPLYRMFGFTPIGTGQSWARFPTQNSQRPDSVQMEAAMAIAEDRPGSVAAATDDGVQFLNGMSAIDLAAALGTTEAARSWLEDHIQENVVAAWRLGLKHEVAALVQSHPPDRSQFPVHQAVVDNDREFLQLLLNTGYDPNVVDHGGRTPLDLATELNRYSLAAQLRSRTRQRSEDG